MVKICISSDQHWSQYSSILRKHGKTYSVRLENLIKSVNWAEDLARENNCQMSFYLGDFFDRTELNSQEITALTEVQWYENNKYFLVGNHESNMMDLNFSTTKIFENIKAKIISKPENFQINNVDLYFIPYISSEGKILSLKDYIQPSDNKKIVFSHNDIAGLRYGKFISQSGFSLQDIENNCTLFINGHLHNSQMVGKNLLLAGNLTGQNFGEDSTQYGHYAYILTIDDGGVITIEPYINPYAFNFYKLYIINESDFSKLKNLKSNSVLSIICEASLLSDVTDILKTLDNVIDYRLVSQYFNQRSSEQPQVEFKSKDYIQQFIEYVQTKLEPSEILSEELANLANL